MRSILLLIITLYWRFVPADKRKRCIYRHSCSQYVYDQTRMFGAVAGLKALLHRAKRCNSNFQLFENPVTGRIELILSTGDVLENSQIVERLSGLDKFSAAISSNYQSNSPA